TLPLPSSLSAQPATRFDHAPHPPRVESSNPYDSIFLSSYLDTTMGHQSLKSHQAANSP
ncbi:hypothetical protein CY34DRAFT_812955, partial [Suillus luteus UH-Slu-Lm8-n1]